MAAGPDFGYPPWQHSGYQPVPQYPGPKPPPRRFTVLALAFLALGIALWVLATAGSELRDFYKLRPYLDHPVLFSVAGTLCLAVAWALGFRRLAVRIVGAVLITLLAIGWGALAAMVVIGLRLQTSTVVSTPSPDGALELLVIRVEDFDPIMEFRVRPRAGILARERDIGCIHTEAGRLHDVSWVGPRTVRIVEGPAGQTRDVDIAVSDAGVPDHRFTVSCT